MPPSEIVVISSSDDEEDDATVVLPDIAADGLTPRETLYARTLISLFVLFQDLDDGVRKRWVETLRDLLHEARPFVVLDDDETKMTRVLTRAAFNSEGVHSHITYARELLGSTVGFVHFLERLRDGLVRKGGEKNINDEMKRYAENVLKEITLSWQTRNGAMQSLRTEIDHKTDFHGEEDLGIFVPTTRRPRRS